jgi:hypothetical protein
MLRRLALPLVLLTLVGCDSAERAADISRGRARLDPVVASLEEYRSAHGAYPPTLGALVDAGLIPAVPALPHRSEPRDVHQPAYDVAPDGSFFTLRFAYRRPEGYSEGEWYEESVYAPDGRGWRAGSPAQDFYSLYLERLAEQYRRGRSADALGRAVRHMVGSGDGRIADLWEDQVTRHLGPGQPAALPPHLVSPADVKVARYAPPGDTSRAFVFVYKARTLPVFDAEGRREVRTYPVLRMTFTQTVGAGGETVWEALGAER